MMKRKLLYGMLGVGVFIAFGTCTNPTSNNKPSTTSTIDSLIYTQILLAEKESNDKQDHEKAIQILQAVLHHPQSHLAVDTSQSMIYHKLGVNCYRARHNEQAISYLDTAIILRTQNTKNYSTVNLAKSYYARSVSFESQFQFKKALEDILEAIKIIEQYPTEQFRRGNYYANAAGYYLKLKEFSKAEQYFNQAENFLEPQSSALATHFFKFAQFLEARGQKKNAVSNYEKAITIYAKLSNETNNLISVKFNLLVLTNSDLAYKEIEKNYQNFLKEFEASNNYLKRVKYRCYSNLAYYQNDNKENQKAYKNYQKALQLAQELSFSDQTVFIAASYEGLGDALAGDKKFDAAIAQYHLAIQALCIGFKTNDIYALPSLKEHVVVNEEELERIMGFKADAILAKYQASGKLTDFEAAFRTYQQLDRLLIQIRQGYKAALSRYDLVRRTLPYYEKATQVALQLYRRTHKVAYLQAAYSFASKNKAVIMLDGLQTDEAGFAGIPADILKLEKSLKSEIYKLDSKIYDLNNQETKREEEVSNLINLRFKKTRAYEDLISQLEKEYPKYHQLKYANTSEVNVSEIRRQLPDSTAVIEYFIGSDSIYIFSYSKRKSIQCLVQKKPDGFGENCLAFRKMTAQDDAFSINTFSRVSHSLYKLLLKETLTLLDAPSEIKRLYIIPDDHLMQISFDPLLSLPIDTALNPGWTNPQPFLLKDFAISYAYSNQLLFDRKSAGPVQGPQKDYIGFGLEYDDYTLKAIDNLQSIKIDTSLTRGMGKLIYSDDEVVESAAILGGTYYVNKKATKSKFKSVASSAKILHLAAHGYVVMDQPLNSGLFFTKQHESDDFILKAVDLYSIKLNARIAVLSACHTGDGKIQKGEGIRSLARAFNYAGCPNVTASLWGAPDLSTKKIIIPFYQYIKYGTPIDVALQKAKLDYIDNCVYNKEALPRNWAHLITIGNMQPIY